MPQLEVIFVRFFFSIPSCTLAFKMKAIFSYFFINSSYSINRCVASVIWISRVLNKTVWVVPDEIYHIRSRLFAVDGNFYIAARFPSSLGTVLEYKLQLAQNVLLNK